MRIRISGFDRLIADQKRAYAEYRFFTSIAPYERQVGTVDIAVGRESTARSQFVCTVSVDLSPSGRIHTQARAMQPSTAIDRAAERTARLIDRHIDRESKVKDFRSKCHVSHRTQER